MVYEDDLNLLKVNELIALMLQSVDELLAMDNGQKNLVEIEEKNDFIQLTHKVISTKEFKKQLSLS